MQALTFHGHTIRCIVGGYEISLTWVRDGAYRVEVRNAVQVGAGYLHYARSFESEAVAREAARDWVQDLTPVATGTSL